MGNRPTHPRGPFPTVAPAGKADDPATTGGPHADGVMTPDPALPPPHGAPGLLLQDWMARELTALSNERTLLSYVRTALAFVAAGFGMIHFFTAPALVGLGVLLAVFGVGLATWGVRRFREVRRVIRVHTALGDTGSGAP